MSGCSGTRFYFAAADAVLAALDAKTGKEVWQARSRTTPTDIICRLAPLVSRRQSLSRHFGGKLGVFRGFVPAFPSGTGKEVGVTYTDARSGRARRRSPAYGRPMENGRRFNWDKPGTTTPKKQPQLSGELAMAGRGWETSVRGTICISPSDHSY